MYPYIHIVLPSYGVMAFVGGFFALLTVYFRTRRFAVEFSDFLIMIPLCVLGGIAGSKVLFALTRLPWLFGNFSGTNLLYLLLRGGFVFYGGLFGVLLALMLYARCTGKYTADVLFRLAAPAIPLFHCFGRIGCFMSGCCYGVALDPPLAAGGLQIDRFPTQLSEALFEALLFLLLLLLEKRRGSQGLLRAYLVLYAAFRFGIEFFRGDEVRGIFGGLSTGQWISLLILLYYAARAVGGLRRIQAGKSAE